MANRKTGEKGAIIDEANLNVDDVEDDGTFIPTGGRQSQALLLSPLDSMCVQFTLCMVCMMGLRFDLYINISDIPTVCTPELIWPVTVIQRLQHFLSTCCANMPDRRAAGKLDLPTFMDRHGQWSSAFDESSLFYYLDEYVKHHAKGMFTVFGTSRDALGRWLASERVPLVSNIDVLARILSLPPHERVSLLFTSLMKYKHDLRAMMVSCRVARNQEAFQLLASLAGASTTEVATSLRPGSRLETLGLIEPPLPGNSVTSPDDLMRVSDRLLHVLLGDYACEADMIVVLTRPAPLTTLSQSSYPHVGIDAHCLTVLLGNASQQRAAGMNILLYGAPGIGKTKLARVLTHDAGYELYEVDYLDKGGNSLTGKDHYRSLQMSQAFLRGRSNAVLLFDEVEDAFPGPTRESMNFFGHEEPRGSINGKVWVNQTLEQNPAPVIWVSNFIRQIDSAYPRRFQFHLELKVLPLTMRGNIIREHLEGLEVSDVFMTKLAARKTLMSTQIDSVARFVHLTQPAMEEPAESLIERQLDHVDQAMGLRSEVQTHRAVTEHKLSYLNLETRLSVECIVEALRAR